MDEAKLGGSPENQLLAHARKVHHQQRGIGQKFDGEIAVGHGVERIAADLGKAQLFGHKRAIQRIRSAGQRGGTQGQHIHPRAGFGQARGIPREHLVPRHQVVAKADWLRDLQMREARHHRIDFPFGQIDQPSAQPGEFLQNAVNRAAQVQTHIGGDLIVARAAGVQLFADFANAVNQPRLDVHVNIFKCDDPRKIAPFNVEQNVVQPAHDLIALRCGEHAHLGQHAGMGDGTGNVLAVQPLIEADRGGKGFHKCISRLVESPAPQLGGGGVDWAGRRGIIGANHGDSGRG